MCFNPAYLLTAWVRNIKAPEGDGNSPVIYTNWILFSFMLETSKPRKGTETLKLRAHFPTFVNSVRNIKAPEGDGNFKYITSSISTALPVRNIKAPEGDGNATES